MDEKLRLINGSFDLRKNGLVGRLAHRRGAQRGFRWRRLTSEEGAAAVGSDEPVMGSSEVRRLKALAYQILTTFPFSSTIFFPMTILLAKS